MTLFSVSLNPEVICAAVRLVARPVAIQLVHTPSDVLGQRFRIAPAGTAGQCNFDYSINPSRHESCVGHCKEVLVVVLDILHMLCAFGLLGESLPGSLRATWRTWSSRLEEDGACSSSEFSIPKRSSSPPSAVDMKVVPFSFQMRVGSKPVERAVLLTTYVRVMHLRRCILTFDMMCNLLHIRVFYTFSHQIEACNVLLFVTSRNVESAPVTLQRHGWKKKQCPVTFRLTNLSRRMCCRDKAEFAPLWVRSAWKRWRNMRAGRCYLLHPRSDRALLVQHHALGHPMPLHVRDRECTGLPFWGLRIIFLPSAIFFDDELELFPPRQPLQSRHCQLEFSGCVEVLHPGRRTCCRGQSATICKCGCLVVAMVCAPPAVVCFE